MNSPIYLQWQQWESRIQEWLNKSDNDLDFPSTLPFDRIILTLLTVKYQLVYQDMDREAESTKKRTNGTRRSTIKLSKTKSSQADEQKERHRDKEKLFHDFTGRLLSPQQVENDTSAEWQEFNQCYEWYGLTFMQRFEQCVRRFISELISTTPEYQELIREPALISPRTEIDNQVYQKKNDGQIFLSVDIKSANFALLQHIDAINARTYPTWSDFLSFFLGQRPLFTQSKKLRMRCLGDLPQYYKLQALWTHYLAIIYQKILWPYLDEIDANARCMALSSDETVFHLDTSIKGDNMEGLIENLERRLAKESPIVKFHVQGYRLRAFHWQNKHMCFGRMFLGKDRGLFDLKCVPDKDRNYDRALADFRVFFGL